MYRHHLFRSSAALHSFAPDATRSLLIFALGGGQTWREGVGGVHGRQRADLDGIAGRRRSGDVVVDRTILVPIPSLVG
jgi:hypothetical protein